MLEDNGVLTEAEQSLKCQYQKGQNQAATVVSGRAFQLFGQSAIIEQRGATRSPYSWVIPLKSPRTRKKESDRLLGHLPTPQSVRQVP